MTPASPTMRTCTNPRKRMAANQSQEGVHAIYEEEGAPILSAFDLFRMPLIMQLQRYKEEGYV